ncbi:MAG: hypothetical protein QM811_12780 [Pirellulales bacterium]
MKINAANYSALFAPNVASAATEKSDDGATAQATTEAQAVAKSDVSGIQALDFSSMTRKTLFDWMNDSIKSGDMSVDESMPFLAMSMKLSTIAGKQDDMAADTELVDFFAKAQDGIASALYFKDPALAERYQNAVAKMQSLQGNAVGIDLFA